MLLSAVFCMLLVVSGTRIVVVKQQSVGTSQKASRALVSAVVLVPELSATGTAAHTLHETMPVS
jgi:hypothetical protein